MEPVLFSAPFMPPIGSPQQCNILPFGDLTIAFEDDLRQLLHCKSNGFMQPFSHQVSQAFWQEFALLLSQHQEWFPSFTDLVDLMAILMV
jgi:naphtho-gamma-pyrone polyketide synthase